MSDLVRAASRFLFSEAAVRGYMVLTTLFLGTLLVDLLARRDVTKFRSRTTIIDFAYWLFYYGGPYQFLVLTPVFLALQGAVRHYTPWLQIDLISSLPAFARGLIFLVTFDLCGYWVHRWTHSNSILWRFHRVHHSQSQLTVLTNYRKHPVDEILPRLLMFGVFLVIGTSPITWATADVVMNGILLLQHSGLSWTYGPVERIVISPRMHGLHHSTEPGHYNTNFGMLFSFWDALFGTRLSVGTAKEFGLTPPMPESLWRQFIDPLQEVLTRAEPAGDAPGDAPRASEQGSVA